VRAYKCLTADGAGVFSGFVWPLPSADGPGDWVESDVEPCRSGIHACRTVDLPYWLTPALFEIELDGTVEEHSVKVVAPRGRLVRRVDGWDGAALRAYAAMCDARARELAASAKGRLDGWLPASEDEVGGPAHIGFTAAAIAEQLDGPDAYAEERLRQSRWLADRLALD
jgi:hypothetical protein